MDIVLVILAGICIIGGFIGCIAPVFPGPSLSYIGFLLMHWSKYAQYSTITLIVLGLITIAVIVMDYLLPVWMTKKMGGSKYGIWGATIGLIIGFFFGLPGIILGPFLGALVGELIGGVEHHKALKSAFGSFVGFLLSTGANLIVCGIIAFYYIIAFF
jgi:uncharacterized protein YqgC (DUF456 family)